MKEAVSVIIPLYNARPYIEQTIKSILDQSYKEFRLYIIDDHSTDGSADIAKEYAKKYADRIVYFRPESAAHQPSTGKNIGIKMSEGEYVAFMDHDDWWTENHLQLLVDELESHPEVGLTGANAAIYDNDQKKELADYRQDPEKLKEVDINQESLLNPPFLTSSCMLFRRAALDKIGLMDERLKMSDDHEIAMRMVVDGSYKITALPDVTIFRRWHQTSLSNNFSSINTALGDAELIYNKIYNYPTITSGQRLLVEKWHQTVKRRWANFLVATGQFKEAKAIYKTLKLQGKQSLNVFVIRLLLSVAPKLAQRIVAAKKRWSFNHPEVF